MLIPSSELDKYECLVQGASEFVELDTPNALAMTNLFGNNVPAQSVSEGLNKEVASTCLRFDLLLPY
jgi:hypothetical protein